MAELAWALPVALLFTLYRLGFFRYVAEKITDHLAKPEPEEKQ